MKKYIAIVFLVMTTIFITSCNNPKDLGVDKSPTGTNGQMKNTEPIEDEAPVDQKDPETDKTSGTDTTSEGAPREVGIYPDMLVPDFTLLDREGNKVTLSEYKGKIVFLNFWATTCRYCIDEMPDLEKFYKAHKDEEDFAFLGVNMTKTWEKKSKDKLIEWLDGEGLTFPVVFDEDGAVAQEWMAQSLPVTFIVTEEGVSLGAIMGRTDLETLEDILKQVREM